MIISAFHFYNFVFSCSVCHFICASQNQRLKFHVSHDLVEYVKKKCLHFKLAASNRAYPMPQCVLTFATVVLFCFFSPDPVRDPWLPVRGGVPCGGAAGSAQGSDGEPDDSIQPGTRGVHPATTFSQHRGGLQSVGPEPGWAAAEAGGDIISICCSAVGGK